MDEAHAGSTSLSGRHARPTTRRRGRRRQWRCEASPTGCSEVCSYELPPDECSRGSTASSSSATWPAAVEDRYRPEMRRMERSLVLQLLDTAWKDHLLAMDHLRSSVGLRGYAQVDPKVEYKREGMRIFEQMWSSVGERVTDLVFRMEQLDERFVGSTWTESEADPRRRPARRRDRRAAAGGHRRHRRPTTSRADPQPPAARRPQRSLPLRQREEVQELLHEEEQGN